MTMMMMDFNIQTMELNIAKIVCEGNRRREKKMYMKKRHFHRLCALVLSGTDISVNTPSDCS